MKILLLGVGMQGKAALHDLAHSPDVSEIIAADADLPALERHVAERGYAKPIACRRVDAADRESLAALFRERPDAAIDLLPARFCETAAAAAVECGARLVNAFYTLPGVAALDSAARAAGAAVLPEFGMDPGIDLVLLGHAARSLDRVEEIATYGAGFPEPAAADNPLKYKITWTFEGVLRAYRRPGRLIRGGRVVEVPDDKMFHPEFTHELDVPGLGRFEAFPNGDAVRYAEELGLDLAGLKELGRYVLRWPGHCAFWRTLVDLGFLDEEPLLVDGAAVDRRRYLCALLEPQLQYRDDERDVALIRVDARGWKGGRRARVLLQVTDYRDLATGFTAMSRTVGFTASIGAQMLARGDIEGSGVLSPARDVPFQPFVEELQRRGVRVETTFE